MSDADTDPLEDRIDRLESVVEEQQRRIDRLRERGDDSGSGIPLSRRDVLVGTGLVGVLAGGAGTAAADPQGQVGTQTDPLTKLYTGKLVFDDTDSNGNRFSLTESAGGDLDVSEGGTVGHRLSNNGDLSSEGTITENASIGGT